MLYNNISYSAVMGEKRQRDKLFYIFAYIMFDSVGVICYSGIAFYRN